ncbi:helix-turn-helix domain-containing protein [Rhizomicrobium electricum]|jgi:transcriptional regulator with XRE-family HTH domain|uniref:Helix-turn-helix domain-containing protein n=1 Tax=Rhizomicrobium electricum TaxID=480070 RepID=A0ABN1EJG7_9PROT|nr:helix-turn-helix transcriptional regulator [Rhizomicrobium electricum]NIJ48311.1 transcriptional regulator with XRE-family HTH domain [Rhizomicrobium electricum]
MSVEKKTKDHNESKKPGVMDQYIGGRLRLWRRTMDVDAYLLAERIGITYQQLQKYEKGMNRISATRLYAIARELNVPIDYFYQEAALSSAAGAGEGAARMAALAGGGGVDLLKCYVSIKDPSVRKAVLNLVRSIVQNDNAPPPVAAMEITSSAASGN